MDDSLRAAVQWSTTLSLVPVQGLEEVETVFFIYLFFFFCVPQLYLWGSPLLGEIFVYVTVFFF